MLRTILENDVDDIFSYRSLEVVAKHQYWEPFTRQATVEFVKRNLNLSIAGRDVWIGLAIISKEDNRLIGDCAFRINETDAEIGCNISPVYQHKGYARETLTLLCDYIFENDSINEIFAITDRDNDASICVLNSIGMTRVEEFENRLICKGQLSVEHKYSIKRRMA